MQQERSILMRDVRPRGGGLSCEVGVFGGEGVPPLGVLLHCITRRAILADYISSSE